MGENRNTDWRELCAAAANEPDVRKLNSLVNQIIEAFDRAAPPRNGGGPVVRCAGVDQ